MEILEIHHLQPESSSRRPYFSLTRPDNTTNASKMEMQRNIPPLLQAVKQTPEFVEFYRRETTLRREPTSPFSDASSVSFQSLLNFHPPIPTSAPCFPQPNIPMVPSPTKALKPRTQHESLDDWIDKLVPYQETVITHKHRSEMTLEESLLCLEHGRNVPKIELLRFSGEAIQWPRFIERFYEHVHNKPYSTDACRMTQLQMHLDR